MSTDAVSVSRPETGAIRATARAVPLAVLPILIGLFFLSGISGLMYEVVWLRVLGHVFGVTVWAASTVLASFMAGLALGGYLAGRVSARVRNPLLWYGGAELLIGVSAVLTPTVFGWLERFYVAIYPALPGELVALTVVRFLLSFAVLLVPTTLMGATLPLVVKSSLMREGDMGRSVSLLYGTNTLGALVGVWAAGFYLIGSIGVMNTFYVALAINLTVGVVAVIASRWTANVAPQPEPAEAHAAAANDTVRARLGAALGSNRVRRAVLFVFFLSGFTSLAYEVIWFRVLTHYQQVTTYAFTVMLMVFLAGIAFGSYLVAPFVKRRIDWLPVLAGIEVLIGLTALASVHIMAHAFDWLEPAIARWFEPYLARILPDLAYTDLAFLAEVAFLSMGPTTLLLGIAFPIGVQLYASGGADPEDVGAPLGRFYAVNTIGAILGSLAGGFLLLPLFGSQHSVGILSVVNVLAGLALLWVRPRVRIAPAAALSAVSLALVAALVLPAPDLLGAILSGRYRDHTLLFHEEGIQTSVSVQSAPGIDHILFLDGSHQANDLPGGVKLHRMIGHMPMLLHPDPKRALVIGLGGGATAGAVSQYEGVQVDIVELAPAVVNGSKFFRHVNYDVLNQPNVHLRLDDGRNYMMLTRQKYDVITADIVHPWHAGAGNLYSTEYYTLAREALTDDGLMCQWIDTVGETEFKLLMRSFVEVFPYVSFWYEGNLMIGSKTPHYFDPDVVARKLANPKTRAALAQVGANTPQDVLNWYNASRPQMKRYLGDGPVITDNSPYVEYFYTLPKDEPLRTLDELRSPNPMEIVKPK